MQKMNEKHPVSWLYSCLNEGANKEALIYYDQDLKECSMTYRELANRVESLAMQLKGLLQVEQQNNSASSVTDGHNQLPVSFVQPIVAVCASRGPDYIIAMLAIWQVGMVYMPLVLGTTDASRRKFITKVEATKAQFLIIDSVHAEYIKKEHLSNDINIIKFQSLKDTPNASMRCSSELEKLSLSDDAYICFPSGTSGSEPRAIMNKFDGLEDRIGGLTKLLMPDRANVNYSHLCYSNFDFDASIVDMLMVLYAKTTLCIVRDDTKLDVYVQLPRLFQSMAQKDKPITSMIMVPDYLRGPIYEGLDPIDFPGLKFLVTMGDSCKLEWLMPWLRSNIKVFNGYGPTEASIAATMGEVFIDRPMSLGLPLPGVDIYLAKENNPESLIKLSPDNTSSELINEGSELVYEMWLGGSGIGCYYNNPELNKTSFITRNERHSIQRLYRTKDLVYVRDNQLYYKSRVGNDRQIKRNGKRIQLDDIETNIKECLKKHIKECRVFYIDNCIIACVFSDEAITNEQLSEEIYQGQYSSNNADKPDFFLRVDKIPTNERGKITLDKSTVNGKIIYRSKISLPLVTDEERQLADCWKKLLLPSVLHDIDNAIPADANFFDFGGDSMMISRLAYFIRYKMLTNMGQEQYFELKNYIYQIPILNKIASFIKTLSYDSAKLIEDSESDCPPLFYLAIRNNKGMPPKRLNRKIYQLTTNILETNDMRTIVGQLVRGIRAYQQTGPYQIVAYEEDEKLFRGLKERLEYEGMTVYGNVLSDQHDNVELVNSRLTEMIGQHLREKLSYYYQQADIQPADGSFPIDYNNIQDNTNVDKRITEFFVDRSLKVIFLRGDTGVGRKTFCQFLAKRLWGEYKQASLRNLPCRLPIYLDLKANNFPNLIQSGLARIGIYKKEQEYLSTMPVVFICVNYDKTGRHDFPNLLAELVNASWKDVKIIVSCRSTVNDALLRCTWTDAYNSLELATENLDIIPNYRRVRSFIGQNNDILLSSPLIVQILGQISKIERPYRGSIDYQSLLLHWVRREIIEIDCVEYNAVNFLSKFIVYARKFYELTGNRVYLEPRKPYWEDSLRELAGDQRTHNSYYKLLQSLLARMPHGTGYSLPTWFTKYIHSSIRLTDETDVAEVDITWLQSAQKNKLKMLTVEELKVAIQLNKTIDVINLGKIIAPIFLFHPLTGETPKVFYGGLANVLGTNRPCICLRMAPSDEDSSLSRSSDMNYKAKYFADLIRKIQPEGDVYLVGWSFGALLAYRVAAILEKERKIAVLLNIDCSSPSAMQHLAPDARAKIIIAGLVNIPQYNVPDTLREAIKIICNSDTTLQSSRNQTELIDAVFKAVIKLCNECENDGKNKAQRFIEVLKNSQINLKACYATAHDNVILQSTDLYIAEPKHTKGVNLEKELAGHDWTSFVASKRVFITQFYDSDHNSIFKSNDFLKYFQNLIQKNSIAIPQIPLNIKIAGNLAASSTPDVYIPQYFEDQESNTSKEAYKTLEEFLIDDKSLMVLHGSAGAGKTTFMRYAMKRLSEKYTSSNNAENWLPIYCDLKTCYRSSNKIDDLLKWQGYTDEEIENYLKSKFIVFMLDKIDEVDSSANERLISQIQTQWPRVRIVLSCRTQYLKNQRNRLLQSLLGIQKHSIIYVLPFSDSQINDYFAEYIRQNLQHVDKDFDHNAELNKYEGMRELISNPLLLSMVAYLLIRHAKSKVIVDKNRPWNRTDIYDAFTQLHINETAGRLEESLGFRPGIAPRVMFKYFNQHLAQAIFFNNNLDKFYNSPDTHLAMRAMWIRITRGKLDFIHSTFAEYFFASLLVEQLQNFDNDSWGVKYFLNHSLMNFIAEKIKGLPEDTYKNVINVLLKFTLASIGSRSEKSKITASNSITAAGKAGAMLYNKDFRGIQIPYADLSNLILSGSDFSDANLRWVNLLQTCLQNVIFVRANLRGVNFGLQSIWRNSNPVTSLCFTPQGDRLVLGDSLGKIRFGRRSTNYSNNVEIYYPSGKVKTPPDETNEYKIEEPVLSEGSAITGISLNNDGLLAYCTIDGKITVYHEQRSYFRHVIREVWLLKTRIKGIVPQVRFSPNGKVLASTIGTDTVCLWDPYVVGVIAQRQRSIKDFFKYRQIGTLIVDAKGHLSTIVYSPDGKLLACVSRTSHCVYLINTVNNVHIGYIRNLSAVSLICADFSSDSAWLAAGDAGGTVHIWEVQKSISNRSLFDLEGPEDTGKSFHQHTGLVNCVRFSYDNKFFASGADDGIIYLRRLKDYQCMAILHGHMGPITALSFRPMSHLLVSASSDKSVRFWKVGEFHRTISVSRIPDHTMISVSTNGNVVAIKPRMGIRYIFLWDINLGCIFNSFIDKPESFEISSNSKYLLANCRGRRDHSPGTQTLIAYDYWKLWNVYDKSNKEKYSGEGIVCLSPDSLYLACYGYGKDDVLKIHNLQNSFTHKPGIDGVRKMQFSPMGEFLVVLGYDALYLLSKASNFADKAHVFNRKTLKDIKPNIISSVVFSPNSEMIAVLMRDDSKVVVVNLNLKTSVVVVRNYIADCQSIRLSNSGHLALATGLEVYILDTQKERSNRVPLSDHVSVDTIEFSDDANTLAVGTKEGVYLWLVNQARLSAIIEQNVSCYSFSPEMIAGRNWLAIGTPSGDVELWYYNKDSWDKLAVMKHKQDPILAIRWNEQEGQLIVINSQINKYVWLLPAPRDSKYFLVWTNDTQWQFTAEDVNIDQALGLSENDKILLKQHGAVGNPACFSVPGYDHTNNIAVDTDTDRMPLERFFFRSMLDKHNITIDEWVVAIILPDNNIDRMFLLIEGINIFNKRVIVKFQLDVDDIKIAYYTNISLNKLNKIFNSAIIESQSYSAHSSLFGKLQIRNLVAVINKDKSDAASLSLIGLTPYQWIKKSLSVIGVRDLPDDVHELFKIDPKPAVSQPSSGCVCM